MFRHGPGFSCCFFGVLEMWQIKVVACKKSGCLKKMAAKPLPAKNTQNTLYSKT